VLPIRGLLYTVSTDSVFLVGVQLLDGIGAGIYGVVGVLMIADLAKGSGHFNLALGAMAVAQGIGAAASNVVAGFVADRSGYDAGFLCLAITAVVGLLWFALAVRDPSKKKCQHASSLLQPKNLVKSRPTAV
jgi:MFS family permease